MALMTLRPIDRDEVLRIIRFRGPLIPNELRKVLKQGDTILIGAMLSELSTKGLVKVSKVKLGGSPFYYDPKNPASLERVAKHLNEKDQRTFQLLKTSKLLRDDEQDALTRVSLRNMKDYALSLTINHAGEKILFWKYFLLSYDEAERLIKKKLFIVEEEERPVPKTQTEKIQSKSTENLGSVEKRSIVEDKEFSSSDSNLSQKKELQSKPQIHKRVSESRKRSQTPQNPTLNQNSSQRTIQTIEPIQDEFYNRVKRFFDKSKIEVREQKLIRKRSELEFVIRVPTPVGMAEYFCKAKTKKKNSDGDLASAKLRGVARGLPILYLTTGVITKKAEGMLDKELKGIVVKYLKE